MLNKYPWSLYLLFLIVWVVLYSNLVAFADFIVSLLPVEPESHLGEALAFFIYDAPKVLLLLSAVVFVMGIINTWFTPERTRALLAGRTLGLANILAASLGVVTPFCSCSAVPLFIGFVQAGVPLGVTFSFLIAAPMVNEIALTLLFGLFGWKIALLYLGLCLMVSIFGGLVLGRLKLEKYLEPWVQEIPTKRLSFESEKSSLSQRLEAGSLAVKDVVGKVWVYIVLGIGVGAIIHGYVPENFMASFMGKDAWWSVPFAVIIGIPMYSSAAGIIPVVQALLAKGAALGTALAFMMSVVALSLPEMIILRKVLTVRLISIFISIVATGILLVGLVFNLVL
ncbi:MAG: permease [FCB group bacterium]|nr:permease [FCB group bacterium]MBL7027295.1 permease [Candidatus Neomarinimicrobiota bacterium]MBL7122265.1 permease [Candidatus Neomarinimicrobiota bacterium]